MRILVTGAAGEFGRDLVPWLAKTHDVRATDIAKAETPCEFMQADLREPEQVAALVEGVDAIIHLAVLLPMDYATTDFVDVNVKATTLLCEAAAKAHVSRMVYISTVWATGHGTEEGYLPVDEDAPCRPQEMYGLTKLQGELSAEYFARKFGLSTIVLRMCGYVRCAQFTPDGTVDLATADLACMTQSALRPGQKIYNPNDLGNVMQSAASLPDVEFERIIVGNHVPWHVDDIDELRSEPMKAAEKYFEGITGMFEHFGAHMPAVNAFYSTAKAYNRLGFRHQFTVRDIMEAYEARMQ